MTNFDDNPQKHLLEQLEDARFAMLGSPNADEHMQPMAPQLDDELIANESGTVYFFSDNTSDLGRAVLSQASSGQYSDVMLTHTEKSYQACVRGRLYANTNPAIIDRFWNPIAASWYPGGKADPKMLVLRFEMEDAAIWTSTRNPLKFLYETTKANMTDTLPDVGEKTHIQTA